MADKNPQSTFGKDILIIAGFILVFLGIGAWLIYSLLQSGDESPKVTKPEEVEAVPQDSTESTSQTVSQPETPDEAEAALIMVLPRDVDKFNEETGYSLIGSGVDSLLLNFSKPGRKLIVEVPAGSKVVSGESSDLPDFYILQSAHFEIGPQDYRAVRLEMVRNSSSKLRQPEESDQFEFAASDPGDQVSLFVLKAEQDGLGWGPVQSGVWMLTENISSEDFQSLVVTVRAIGSSTNRPKTTVANYEELKKTGLSFQKLGWDASKFRLLVYNQRKFQSTMREMDFENPGKNFSSHLTNKTLLEYQVEPEVEDLLLRYLFGHHQPHIRLSALKNLLEMEVRQTAENLLAVMQGEKNRHAAFLAAHRLFQLEDERSLPLLTAFEKDPDLKPLFERKTAARIREVSGKGRKSNEDLLSFWTRTIGWESLSDNGETIREMVETLSKIPDPLLAEALQKAASGDFKEANAALNQLKKYPQNRDAFDALVKLASSHPEDNIRYYATGALNRFNTFDLRDFCEERLKRDSDHRVAQSALSLAVRQKFPGYDEVVLLGCRNTHPKVREWAANALGNNKMSEGSGQLLKMAQMDSEEKVRQSALRALSQMKNYDVLAVLKKLLRSSQSNDKWTALNTIRLWESNPDALDLLVPYREDAVIGKSVTKHLAGFGR